MLSGSPKLEVNALHNAFLNDLSQNLFFVFPSIIGVNLDSILKQRLKTESKQNSISPLFTSIRLKR